MNERAGFARRLRFLAVVGILLTISTAAHADIGLPMIVLAFPVMLVSLLPIIAVEALLVASDLSLPIGRSFRVMGLANLVSTIAGVPIAWIVMVPIQVFGTWVAAQVPHERLGTGVATAVLGAAWLPNEVPFWIVSLALCVLLVPTFFLSWLIEGKVMWRFFLHRDETDRLTMEQVWRATLRANVTSYALLALAVWVLTVIVR